MKGCGHSARGFVSVAVLAASLAAGAGTNDLEIARQALRDGLWSVARAHATKADGPTARLIVLETYAHENRWEEVAKALAQLKEVASEPGFAYYRAVTGGDLARAVELLRKGGSPAGAESAKMLEADLMVRSGDMGRARALWSAVAASSNASERAVVTAALNLGDVSALRTALARATVPVLQRQVSLRLGVELLHEAATAAEGEKLVKSIGTRFPDTPDACSAYVALAAAQAEAGRWREAAKTYDDICAIWPAAKKLFAVQQGRGEALLKQGGREDALKAFEWSETLTSDDAERALAVLRQGDVLVELGRSEDALARYRRVLGEFPDTEVAAALKRMLALRELETNGRESFKDYRFADAQKAFAEVAKADPARRSRMEYFIMLCRYGLGQDAEAKAEARHLAETCGEASIRAEATLWLAKFTYNRGEWKESYGLFDAFVKLAPEHPYAPKALAWSARAAYADNDFNLAIQAATRLVDRYPASPARFAALLVQGEALIELARFDAAVLVLDGIARAEDAAEAERLRARILRADALFAMGADNPKRYASALEAYQAIRFGGTLEPSLRLAVSFKIARTLEKLKRYDEAADEYYSQVVLAYRDGRLNGERYDDDARAAFSRAAFRLAEEFESRGRATQARGILKLVAESDVPAADEARRRLEGLEKKGRFL